MHYLLAHNIPILLIWEKDEILFTPALNDLFGDFRDQGILHADPDSLLTFLAEHWDHLEDWWVSLKVQKVISAFNKNYALSDSDWHKSWTGILQGLEEI